MTADAPAQPQETPSSLAAPTADVLEQNQEVTESPPRPDTLEMPLEASEADAMEQAHPVVLDDDRDR